MFKELATGALGLTVVFDGACQAKAIRRAEKSEFAVVAGVDAAGNVSDYNIIEGADIRSYLAQEFSAFGLAHTSAYPAASYELAESLQSKLQQPVTGHKIKPRRENKRKWFGAAIVQQWSLKQNPIGVI